MMLAFSTKFNAFYGDNAAGKTSILEAIYYLSTGKSFRSAHHDVVIAFDQPEFTLFAEAVDEFSEMPIGLQRCRDGSLRVHLCSEAIKSITEISKLLPILFILS